MSKIDFQSLQAAVQSLHKVMKNSDELGINFYEFIKKNSSADVRQLILSGHGGSTDFPLRFAVTQIECRQKTLRKLSSFIIHPEFLFPSVQAAEQATHQCVASYHALLAGGGLDVADLTGGLGIDAFTLAMHDNYVTVIELDSERANILRHNTNVLGLKKMRIIEGDSITWLKKVSAQKHFDLIFVDPARRDSYDRRKFMFRDCLPDIVGAWGEIIKSADRIMIKASPLIDIDCALRDFDSVEEIHLVCVKGECKEVLLIARGGGLPNSDVRKAPPRIIAVDVDDCQDASVSFISRWQCSYSDLGNVSEFLQDSDLSEGTFLYDPNAAVHKLHCSYALCCNYQGLVKLSANTDLYWSANHIKDFPGRTYRIAKVIDNRCIKFLKGSRYEVAVRNYPLSAEQLRIRLGVLPGGNDRFIYGCRVGDKAAKILLECLRL